MLTIEQLQRAPPESAPAPTMPQLCAEAFRIFKPRTREQNPHSDVYFVLLGHERVAASCDSEFIFGDMRLDPATNSAMVRHHDRETGALI